MKWISVAGVIAVTLIAQTTRGADETFDEAIKRAGAEYGPRYEKAVQELNTTRERIGREKAPLLKELRAREDEVIALEIDLTRLDPNREKLENERRGLLKEFDGLRKNSMYVTGLGRDVLKTLADTLAPGEQPLVEDALLDLQQKLEQASQAPNVPAALDALEMVLARSRRYLGGAVARGSATVVFPPLEKSDWLSFVSGVWNRSTEGPVTTSQLQAGRLAFIGPEVFFLSDTGGPIAAVRAKEGSKVPIAYALRGWQEADASPLFDGKLSAFPADASKGKALRLEQTRGTVRDHIEKGGVVAYAILGVGVVSLLLIAQKAIELARLSVGARKRRRDFLGKVSAGAISEAEEDVRTLPRAARELVAEGLRHFDAPKSALEAKLESVLLGLRLKAERRLPLLAVIATAAPLMGLLGTVTGMVKTFALITVFGTGNAGKLSSGISEVLVATELGLAVAIPTLVAHGFLAHRAHKQLAELERLALDFVSAVEVSKARAGKSVSLVSEVA